MSVNITVHCGGCAWWDALCDNKKRSAETAKKWGWTRTRKHGWRCPRCSKGEEPKPMDPQP